MDDTLYYLHADPAHTMLSVSDAQGNSQGHLWYDPHGSVLSSTLPVTLTEQLLSSQGLDSRLGLVYHGDGRYYDPAIAHTLQPDPFGGVPQLPQTLNRYAVPTTGAVVGQAAGGWSPLLSATGSEALETGAGMALGAYANSIRLSGYLYVQANEALLGRAGYQSLFTRMNRPGQGRSAWYVSRRVTRGGGRTYRVVGTDEVIDLAALERAVVSNRWPVHYPLDEPFSALGVSALDDTALKRWLRSGWGDFFSGWGIELVFAIPELIAPLRNPYFNTEQRVVQTIVTGGGTLASAGAGTWVGFALAGAELGVLGGPVIFVASTATGVAVFALWEYAVKPTVSWAFITVGRPDPYQEYRNLRPLGSEQ